MSRFSLHITPYSIFTRFFSNVQKFDKGFTLIELMISISIIAVLATVGFVIYSNVQKNARVSKRIQDLKAIKLAIETYKTTEGRYPVVTNGTNTGWRSECPGWGGKANNDVLPNSTGFIPKYMVNLPQDPSMDLTTNRNCYLYRSDGIDYKIMDYNVQDMTNNELANQPELVDPRYNNPSNFTGLTITFCTGASGNGDNRAWSLYSGGGRCF